MSGISQTFFPYAFIVYFLSVVPLRDRWRTHHIRMDKLRNENGEPIPRNTPYAVLVESNTPIVCQYSRLDTSAPEMALMTTIAYPVEE